MNTLIGGQLWDKENRPFKFEVKPGNRPYNQAHYEALGEVYYASCHTSYSNVAMTTQVITEHVYGLLENEAKLQRVIVPVSSSHNEETQLL